MNGQEPVQPAELERPPDLDSRRDELEPSYARPRGDEHAERSRIDEPAVREIDDEGVCTLPQRRFELRRRVQVDLTDHGHIDHAAPTPFGRDLARAVRGIR